jgi:hypothetical protein
MRYWSLIRMLYCPLRSPPKASRGLPGGMSRSVTEISDCLRGVQSGQTAQGDRSHIRELFDALPLEKAFGLLASEAPDHNIEVSRATLYVKRTDEQGTEERRPRCAKWITGY